MDDLETEQLTKLGFEIPLYFRYVDDILLALPKCKIGNVLEGFNSNKFNIKFTLETEVNKSINFLDCTFLRNEEQKITCNWYRKPTWSGRCLNFDSNHSKKYKKSVIYNMVDRAVLLADKQFHRENLRLVEDTLFDNFYPQKFIRENINIRLNNLAGKEQLASNQIAQNNEMRSFISSIYPLR